MKNNGELRFVRYADDFQVWVRNEPSVRHVFASVKQYLMQHLQLVVNEDKSCVRSARGYKTWFSLLFVNV